MVTNKYLFSIIIPTKDRLEELTRCLESLTNMNYPQEYFEVIVVDDGSQIPINDVCYLFEQKLNLTLISQTNAGPATARNTGAKEAQGKYLAFTDDDCRATPEWLNALENQFQQTPDCLIGGKTINALPENLYSTASQLLIDYLYQSYNVDPENAKFLASNNLALSAKKFHELGGFDSEFPIAAGEDRDFCTRWLNTGQKIVYVSNALVYHAHHLDLYSFWRQNFNYGMGASHYYGRLQQDSQAKVRRRPSISFYLKLLIYPFSVKKNYQGIPLTLLFCLAQIAVGYGFFEEKYLKLNHKN